MQNLLFDITGQTLHFDCPEGRPSSVTSVTVFEQGTGDDGTAEAATTGSAAVETNPNTTFDASSGYGQADETKLNIAATTGIEIGRRYLATNSQGEAEMVEVTAIESGAEVYSRYPLRNAYESGDSFVSTRISISVDSTWIADETNISDDTDPNPGYRVRWVYVVGGVTFVHFSQFNVVRYEADHDATPGTLSERCTNWINDLPVEHQEDRGERLIAKAYSTLGFDLHRLGIAQEMMRNRSVVTELTELKAVLMMYSDKAKTNGETIGYEIARDEYQAALDGLVAAGKTDVALDEGGGGYPGSYKSLWSK